MAIALYPLYSEKLKSLSRRLCGMGRIGRANRTRCSCRDRAWNEADAVGLSARKFENQEVEASLKCQVLNRMAALGLPKSERVLPYLSVLSRPETTTLVLRSSYATTLLLR